MLTMLSLTTLLLLSLTPAHAATWYFLTYSPPSGGEFTSLSGTLHIPTLPRAGTYYLWPGLQPTDNSGVYQNVLDGRSGTWWIGSGWCCENPSLPWGSGFNTDAGETVAFSNVRGSGAWTSTLTRESTGERVQDEFALDGKVFNQAIFAIELDGVGWDFGPLEFEDVTITSTGSSTSWCNTEPSNYNSATNFAISGVSASVSDGVVTCKIASLTLESPK